jgi:predicted  nucleic acid-binding Zn-ribbon protein
MIFDFNSLLDKVRQLVELSQALRSENAALRSELASLSDQNVRLEKRMQEAHERVARLIDALPSADADQEAA